MAEVKKYGLTRLGSKPGKFKRLVKKHLGSKAAEKIDGSDGDKIMAIAKKQNNTNLYKQGSFIKNFYGKEEVMNEDKDYEGDMAKAQLDAIADKASELSDMLDDEDELEAWVQSKITKAKDYINAVYDNMMYDDDEDDEVDEPQQMDEEADYKVNVEGLPTFFMTGSSAEDIKKKLRMMLKKSDMIQSVDRVTKADVKKAFRMKGMGKDEEINEARRGRPSSDQEDGMENLMIQLNKVITLRGQKPVEFANGKKVTMRPQTAQMVLNKIKGTKDGAKRQQMMNQMAKSPEDMKAVMREQVELTEEQITVGDYQTKNFDICPSAVSLYKKLEPNDLVIRTAKMHDILFGMEKKAIEADTATKDEVDAAQKLADQIMKMAKMMGKEEEHNYVQSHVDKMKQLAGMQEALDPVNKKAVKKDFDDRMDKDIDNDGDVDASDRYLHKRRKAVTKAIHAVKKNNK